MITETSILPVQSKYELDEKSIQATILHELPLIVGFEKLLDDDECEGLIALSAGQMERSKLASKQISDYRTSSGTFLEDLHPLVRKIEQRISKLLNISIPFFEGLQILHYKPGQKFSDHYDYFGPTHPSSDNNRICTLIMYLNDVGEGGETSFPRLNLSISPKKGNAVYFEYFYQNEKYNELTLHSGDPVIKGEKWIATQWVRRQKFRH